LDAVDLGSLGIDVTGLVSVLIEQPAPPPAPQTTTAVITVQTKGAPAMGLTVDDKTGNIVLGFTDDKGDPTGPPPGDGSGLVVTITGDNDAVCALGTVVSGTDVAGNATYEAPAVPATEGSFNASAAVANTSGAPLTDADGTTPFVQPGTIAVPVSAGQAAAGSLAEVG